MDFNILISCAGKQMPLVYFISDSCTPDWAEDQGADGVIPKSKLVSRGDLEMVRIELTMKTFQRATERMRTQRSV